MSQARSSNDEAFRRRIVDNIMVTKLRELRRADINPYLKAQDPVGLDEVFVDGKRMIQLGSSNYLGLAQDPRVIHAALEAVETYGTSCTASRLLTGTRPLHEELEACLAKFLGKEDALAFTTGYLAATGAIPALVGRHDAVFMDAEVHACLIDGIRLSGADMVRFNHNDAEDLERQLVGNDAARKLIVIDSLYSMNGDIAPLPAIVELAEAYGAWVFLDDAHATGVVGPGGRGLAHAYGLEDKVDIIMGVFSKSLAATGGFVAGSAELIDHLRINARSFMFSNALAPAQAAATFAALKILMAEPERAALAMERADQGRKRLREIGWRCGGDGCHMVPVMIGDYWRALQVTKALAEHGVIVSPAVQPAVPKGKDLLRLNFSPTLTAEQFESALGAFEAVWKLMPEQRQAQEEEETIAA
jgi:8-amino-7-oxononanoate synthase